MNAINRSASRLAAVALAAIVTIAMLAGVNGLAGVDHGAQIAKATVAAARG